MQVGLTMYVLAANGVISGINACIVPRSAKPVSYTHLTLPTILLV